jgi:hypothetical protein
MTTLAAPTLFPIPPDGAFPITLSRAWLTDVQRTRSGNEVRLALRSRPVRRLEYKATLAESVEIVQFLALWLAAAELLRFNIPVWPEDTDATAFADDHTIMCDTTDREFIAGEQAIIWVSETECELFTIDTIAGDRLTTVDPIVGSWASYLPASILVAPVMTAWLSPPTREQRTPVVEHVTLVFDEELPGVAGLDASIGGAEAPLGVSIVLDGNDGSTGNFGQTYGTVTAHVLDASGQEIREPLIVWTVTPIGVLGIHDPGVRITFPQNGMQAHVEYVDLPPSFTFTATYGGASASANV